MSFVKKSLAVLLYFIIPMLSMSQVGIGTITPNPSAKLDVTATDKGFLTPRVNLTGTGDVSTIATPATGLLVYNLVSAGSGVTAVTPGFYYYDGTKWQRIINQQPDATVSFNTDNPNPPNTPTFDPPGNAASKDFIYVSSTNNSQWTYNGTAYVTYNPPPSTAWMSSGLTTDAGSTKSGTIYRTGSVGIGSTTTPNASAQLDVNATNKGFLPPRVALTSTSDVSTIASPATGLLVYNTASAGSGATAVTSGYYYYDGSSWQRISTGLTGDLPSWTNAGTVQSVGISATTTAPTLPTTTTRNQVLYRQLGPKTWQVMVVMEWSSATGATAGSGDYLFTLPNGLRFDTNIEAQQAYQLLVGTSSWYHGAKIIPGGTVTIYYNNGTEKSLTQGGVIVWDATRYRVPANAGASFLCIGGSYYSFNYGPSSFAWTFTFQST